MAEDLGTTLARCRHPGEQLQQRALAGAVATDDANDFSGVATVKETSRSAQKRVPPRGRRPTCAATMPGRAARRLSTGRATRAASDIAPAGHRGGTACRAQSRGWQDGSLTSDDVREGRFHVAKVAGAADQHRTGRHRGDAEHRSRLCPGIQQRPAKPFDHASHRIQRVHELPSVRQQAARICDGRGEQPELCEKWQRVSHVTVFHVQRRQPERKRRGPTGTPAGRAVRPRPRAAPRRPSCTRPS